MFGIFHPNWLKNAGAFCRDVLANGLLCNLYRLGNLNAPATIIRRRPIDPVDPIETMQTGLHRERIIDFLHSS
ncbi:MAG: hypothetical protein AAFN70_02135 [Planctomycetota bacterium]